MKATLMDIARPHPRVLAEPAPEALFAEFGPSSLNFELRVFINFTDGRPQARDELPVAIDRAFRERKMVIAFPQMVVYVTADSKTDRDALLDRPERGGAESL